jgi:SpoVK/Ycf46/Vps4 family AAA+-type ATPase
MFMNKSDTQAMRPESLIQRLEATDTSAQLSGATVAEVRRIAAALRHRARAAADGPVQSQSSGNVLLFSGPSGTGKVLAAQALAHELGLNLFKVDVKQITNKFIGETEKNLSAIFQEGQASNAVLFFDEADALFGKRTDVKDSHDRYANLEVNSLLQQIEGFRGIVILACNQHLPIDRSDVFELPFTE